MDLVKTGRLISVLRREKGLTQRKLAEKLGISPKTVSKWETGKGFPDVTLITELSKIFMVDIVNLLSGEMPEVKKASCNIQRMGFYVCPVCGNVITAMGKADILCCGRTLSSFKTKEADDAHKITVENIEDDWYITFSHPMEKEHFISFFAYVRFDRVLTVKLYPEQGGEVRLPVMRGGKLYYFCSNHGLFEVKI